MYTPRYNRQDDPAAIAAFVRENRFATLITAGSENVPRATHLPLVLLGEPDGALSLLGHVARANPQWEDFGGGREALAIFQGPHAYISPEHYERPLSVPTWNYVAVHLYGAPRILETPEEKRRVLDALIAQEDGAFAAHLAAFPDDVVQAKLRAIVAFEMPVMRVEARYKLSQDRSDSERNAIITALAGSGFDAERGIADAMAVLLSRSAPPPFGVADMEGRS